MRNYRLSIPLHGPRRGQRRLSLPPVRRAPRPRALPRGGQGPLPLLWRLGLVLAIACLLSMVGCATTPRDISMGARQSLHQVQLLKVVMLPTVAPAPFGLSPQEQEAMLQLYQDQTQKHLKAQGLQVVSAREVLERFPAQVLAERMDLDDLLLAQVFEEDSGGALQDRRALVYELGRAFGADAVMVSQVIYHSTATCDPSQESPYTPHVFTVQGEPQGDSPVPCAISHFEAKLVHAETGQTLWYNRALRELRASGAQDPTPDASLNARDNVDMILQSPHAGLELRDAQRAPGS